MSKTEGRRGNLVVELTGLLRERIRRGEFPVGARLPSEAQLAAAQGVSRTVVREAIAALRADGLVQPRQGAGVFVLEGREAEGGFRDVAAGRISSVIEVLELRIAVEVEAAGLAAQRRSPLQQERIIESHRALSALVAAGGATEEADFDLHLAVSEATNNGRFREFMAMLGPDIIPRRALGPTQAHEAPPGYLSQIEREHLEIVEAILQGDRAAAQSAMRRHLEGSLARYTALLQAPRPTVDQ